MKKFSPPFALVLLIVCIHSFIFSLCVNAQETSNQRIAKVTKVIEHTNENNLREQLVTLSFRDDNNIEQTLFINNLVPDNQAYAIVAETNREYLINTDENSDQMYISDYYREKVLITLIIIFCFLVIALGGSKGVKALISLILTAVAIIYVLIPGIKTGASPITLAITISAFATAVTMTLIAGFNKKSLAATLGTVGGVSVAGLLAQLVIQLAPLSGLASTEAHILLANSQGSNFDFQGILAAGILIASLGASMDVSISIASAIQELCEVKKQQNKKELFKHAMNIGKDIMGTMTNTLILAYTGASIPLLILLSQDSGLRILNIEIIATEISAALIGSIGLLLAIPITAIVGASMHKSLSEN